MIGREAAAAAGGEGGGRAFHRRRHGHGRWSMMSLDEEERGDAIKIWRELTTYAREMRDAVIHRYLITSRVDLSSGSKLPNKRRIDPADLQTRDSPRWRFQ